MQAISTFKVVKKKSQKSWKETIYGSWIVNLDQ